MRVLVTGATGFIGGAVVDALIAHGHDPVPAVRDVAAARRRWPLLQAVQADFMRDLHPADWVPRLAGIDAVVNAVGILRENRRQTFAALHSAAPRALFAACVDAGVSRVVQVSALGADDRARSRYHLSKREADRFLATLPLRTTVVQPSVVFAPEGASARAFLAMAALPITALPGGGVQRLAPVHLDDVVEVILRSLESEVSPALIEAAGGECVTLRGYLAHLRHQLGLGPLRVVAVPMPIVRSGAHLMAHVPGSMVDPETVAMLERGNCAPTAAFAAFMGRPPRAVATFIAPREAGPLRQRAQLQWLLPLLRLSIAAVWILTAFVSVFAYPIEASLDLLARSGIHGALGPAALYGSAALDLLLGILMLLPINRRPLYIVQMLLIVGYTAVISVALPEFWRHPYGPLLKNLPILAALLALHQLENKPGE